MNILNEIRPTTMYKNNSRDSSKFNGCSPLQLPRKLKDLSTAVGYYSYTNRYGQVKKTKAGLRKPKG